MADPATSAHRGGLRLGTRLFLLVALSSLLPAALVLLAGWWQLRQQVRLWTIPSVEASLDASVQSNRAALDRLQRNLESAGRALAENPLLPQSARDTTGLGAWLDVGRGQFGIDLAQFYERDGERFRLQVSRNERGRSGPDASRILPATTGDSAGPQRPTVLRLNDGSEDYLAIPTYLWTGAVPEGAPRLRGALVLGVSLGPRYYERLGQAATGLQFYRRLEEFGLVLRTGYGLLAGIILLLCLGLSLWIAARVAGSVSHPVEDLVRGMEEVGRIATRDPGQGGSVAGAAERSRIPEMARLAAAFHRMRGTLQAYEERLRESERVRGAQETARFVAHEIRNTLTPVNAALSVLERQLGGVGGEARERGERALELIRREAQRMASLAGAFSEYARFPERRPVPLDLAELIETQARSEIPERITLTVERAEHLPKVTADRDEMERIFRNLIKNAVEAIPAQGTIRLAFSTGPTRESLRIALEDSGAGMDPETLRKAFQPGFTTKEGGTGVGLALVRSGFSHYGGTVRIESRPGEGTRFRLEIPAARGGDEGEGGVRT